MRAIIHLKHSQDRNALPGGDRFVSIAPVMVCPRPAGAVPPVGADGVGRLAVGGVAVQMWGG